MRTATPSVHGPSPTRPTCRHHLRGLERIPKGQVIQSYGYDENVMPNGRLLNRDDLDKAFPDNPALVGHVSMRSFTRNSCARISSINI